MEKKDDFEHNSISPIKELKYSQSVEEMEPLINYIKEHMKVCPNDDIILTLVENIDYFSLRRNFSLKTKAPIDNNDEINIFKENLLSDLASLESFISIPDINSFEIQDKSNKGGKFKSPPVFDINGDEVLLGENSHQFNIFYYDNIADLGAFVEKNKNSNIKVSCVGVNINFFETKKWIKNYGLLHIKNYSFYFIDINNDKEINYKKYLKLENLPRIILVDNEIIVKNKSIKHINTFDLQKDLAYKENEQISLENIKKEKFIFLENENKKKIVKSMNIYLKNNGLNKINFYVKLKIAINNKGVKKMRCYPVLYGEANIGDKDLIDNLINILNGQKLFYDIQRKINYSNGYNN